ncbi:MAG: response regulator [Thermodesulfobacteriota bacterium]
MAAKHILLAENDESLAHIMALLLKQAEFRVSTASSSAEAAQLLATLEARGEAVDLVITDLCRQTAEADRRLLHAMAAKKPAVPVIAITTTDDDAQRHRLTGLGCTTCITKPFAAETLMHSIHAVLH